jgi:hypothetical protein
VDAGSRGHTLTLLDNIIPDYDASSRHTILVRARPADVYEVAREADLGRSLLVRVLVAIRAFPAVLATVVRGHGRRVDQPSHKTVGRIAFTLIDEAPGQEFVLGIMGRFWTPTGQVVASTPDQFRQPPPAGLAQGVWSFRVTASGAGTVLSTETRVRCSDPVTRRQFARYWRIVRLGSGLIRRRMLRQIRSEAERRSVPITP